MNILYAKSILYAYANIEAICNQIDELVEKKALVSMFDFSPCLEQCDKILSLTNQKDILYEIKRVVDGILPKFSEKDLLYLDYKYFHKLPKENFEFIDTFSRAYFRRQVKLASLFSEKLEKKGIDDNYFEKFCFSIDFFKELFKRVVEHETKCIKNKKAKSKYLKALKSA